MCLCLSSLRSSNSGLGTSASHFKKLVPILFIPTRDSGRQPLLLSLLLTWTADRNNNDERAKTVARKNLAIRKVLVPVVRSLD
jgi:hypothetical protein